MPAGEDVPVSRFEPLQQFTWSQGWSFDIVNRVRVNNYGFVSDWDYDAKTATPLLAVLGDSFVEALMVPYEKTCAGRLADHLQPRRRVYSFGMSGAPLSEYLAYARWAQDEFRPSGMVFVVVVNDFHESWLKYSWSRLPFSYFDEDEAGSVHLVNGFHYRRSWWRRLMVRSRLIRYMYYNVDLATTYQTWSWRRAPDPSPVTAAELMNDPADARPELQADSRRAIDHFFDLLPEMAGLAPAQIAFVVDGPRAALYSEGAMERIRDSHWTTSRQYFMTIAESLGYEVLDLLPVFTDHWKENRARFDWPKNGHWNALGHSLCAEAVAKSAALAQMD